MENNDILRPKTFYEIKTGLLSGEKVMVSQKTLGEISNIFENQDVIKDCDLKTIAYRVFAHLSVSEGTPGGLFFGTSILMPGKVGNEYYMTKGHFHSKKDRAEYYWCISGKGCLILMDEEGTCTAEEMYPGTLHYIPGKTAHRIANTGNEELVMGACWPSDAGHDYETISNIGFSSRLLEIDGVPTLRRCAKK